MIASHSAEQADVQPTTAPLARTTAATATSIPPCNNKNPPPRASDSSASDSSTLPKQLAGAAMADLFGLEPQRAGQESLLERAARPRRDHALQPGHPRTQRHQRQQDQNPGRHPPGIDATLERRAADQDPGRQIERVLRGVPDREQPEPARDAGAAQATHERRRRLPARIIHSPPIRAAPRRWPRMARRVRSSCFSDTPARRRNARTSASSGSSSRAHSQSRTDLDRNRSDVAFRGQQPRLRPPRSEDAEEAKLAIDPQP